MTHTPDMSDLNEWMAGRVDKAEAAIRTAEVDGERHCHSEYGSANCKWEPGVGCTPKCPECIPMGGEGMSLMQHSDKVISRMRLDICRLIEERAILVAIRDKARDAHATGAGTYNDKRTSVDRKKLSDLGLMVKESYKVIP